MSEMLFRIKATHTIHFRFAIMIGMNGKTRGGRGGGVPSIPALSHVICIGGPDHENSHVGQRHQQVLTSARLPVSATPCRLEGETKEKQVVDTSYSRFQILVLSSERTSLKVTVMVCGTRGSGLVCE